MNNGTPSPMQAPRQTLKSEAGMRLGRPVALIGLMGAGKSTVGRRLAKALDLEFRDTDDAIVEAAGCSISDIFEIYGEAIFRDLEQRIVARLLKEGPCILATGGGAFMNAAVRASVKEHAVSVWLRADLDILVDRVSRRNTRPLLEQGDKRDILQRLMNERYPVYAEADITVDTDNGSHETVVRSVITALEGFADRHAVSIKGLDA